MAGIRIEGNTSGHVAEVNMDNELYVRTTATPENAGFTTILSENDPGTITGSRFVLSPETSDDYRLRVGIDSVTFNELFPGTTLNSSLWTAPTSVMTISVSSGFATLNANSSTANGAVARLSSYKFFQTFMSYPLYFEAAVQFPFAPVANNVTEFGFGIASGTSTPTDGAFFRFTAAGTFVAVANYNGSETTSSTLSFASLIGANKTVHVVITIQEGNAYYWIDNVLVATIPISLAGSAVTSAYSLPLLFRTYNTGVTAQAQQLKIGMVGISIGDMQNSKDWSEVASGAGWSATQWSTGATSVGSTAQWTNNANPASAQPTNTTAALGTGFGGIFLAQVNGLAITTDYIISSFQNPMGTSTAPGRNLYITGVSVSSVWKGATNAATIQTWVVGACWGHTSVSLATTETAVSKAPRKMLFGTQTIPGSAAIGTMATPEIEENFVTPVVIFPGEYFQVVMRYANYVSVNNAEIWFYIKCNGYWD